MSDECDALHQKSTYDGENAHDRLQSMRHKTTDEHDETTPDEHHEQTYADDEPQMKQELHPNGHK